MNFCLTREKEIPSNEKRRGWYRGWLVRGAGLNSWTNEPTDRMAGACSQIDARGSNWAPLFVHLLYPLLFPLDFHPALGVLEAHIGWKETTNYLGKDYYSEDAGEVVELNECMCFPSTYIYMYIYVQYNCTMITRGGKRTLLQLCIVPWTRPGGINLTQKRQVKSQLTDHSLVIDLWVSWGWILSLLLLFLILFDAGIRLLMWMWTFILFF